jgi:hypothetical protein
MIQKYRTTRNAGRKAARRAGFDLKFKKYNAHGAGIAKSVELN